MIKKIISILLIMTLSFTAIFTTGSLALDSDPVVANIINSLLEMPDRAENIEGLSVLLATEDGPSVLLKYSERETSVTYSLLKPAIDMIGLPTLQCLLETIDLVSPSIREKYFEILATKEGKELNSEEKAAAEFFVNEIYDAYPEAEQLFREDNITPEFVVNFISALYELNDNEVMIVSTSPEAEVEKHYLSRKLIVAIDEVWDKYSDKELFFELNDFEGKIDDMIDSINQRPPVERAQMKTLLKAAGLYAQVAPKPTPTPTATPEATATPTATPTAKPTATPTSKPSTNNGSNGGPIGGTTPTQPTQTATPAQTLIPSLKPAEVIEPETVVVSAVNAPQDVAELVKDGIVLEVSATNKEGNAIDGTFKNASKLQLTDKAFAGMANPMLYYIATTQEDERVLLPVKQNVFKDDTVFFKAEATGNYVVKSEPKYFYDANGWGASYIEMLYQRTIVNGVAENTFMPDKSIKREEFVKLIVEMFDLTNDENVECTFTDVDKNAWYYPFVATAYSNGIINGMGNNTFGVGMNISRQDMAKIIIDVANLVGINTAPDAEYTAVVFGDYADIADYAADAVEKCRRLQIISGDENGRFNPRNFSTRQEAAKMMYQLLVQYLQN